MVFKMVTNVRITVLAKHLEHKSVPVFAYFILRQSECKSVVNATLVSTNPHNAH